MFGQSSLTGAGGGGNSGLFQSSSLSKTQIIRDRGIIYKTDGSGRDTYIYNDNGGFAIMHQPKQYEKPGSFLPNVQKRYKEKLPTLNSKQVNYRQDGSGRDSYIMVGNGGYQNPSKHQEFREAFKNSLRSYERNDSYLASRKSSIVKRQQNVLMSIKRSLMQDKDDSQERNASLGRLRGDEVNQSFNNNTDKDLNNNVENIQTLNLPQYSQTIRNSPQTSNKASTKDIIKIGQNYLESQQLYTKEFGQSRNVTQQAQSALSSVQILKDNPKVYQVQKLVSYQKNLNERLAKPRYLPGEGEGSLTRNLTQNFAATVATTTQTNSPERLRGSSKNNLSSYQKVSLSNTLNFSSKKSSNQESSSRKVKAQQIRLKKLNLDQSEVEVIDQIQDANKNNQFSLKANQLLLQNQDIKQRNQLDVKKLYKSYLHKASPQQEQDQNLNTSYVSQ